MAGVVRLCAFCAFLTLVFSGRLPAIAQSSTEIQNTDVMTVWSEAHRARAMEAETRTGLTADEIAAIKPLLEELEDSEKMRLADINRIQNDLLFVDRLELDVEARTQQINAEHSRRVERIWAAIGDRIGAARAGSLRAHTYGTAVVEQTTLYQSEHMAKIDQALADWDKATQERIVLHEQNRLIREQIAANDLARQEVAAAASTAPGVTVSPVVEQPAGVAATAESPRAEVAAPPAAAQSETAVESAAAARRQRGASEPQPVNRRKKIRGLG